LKRIRNETHLVAGGTARLELLSVVPLAVELLLVNAVSQVDQQFGTGGALEAGRMPGHVFAKLWSHDAERASRNVAFTTITLLEKRERERERNQPINKQIKCQTKISKTSKINKNKFSSSSQVFLFLICLNLAPFQNRHLTNTCLNTFTMPSILGATFDNQNKTETEINFK
jgi:hypothetical protein